MFMAILAQDTSLISMYSCHLTHYVGWQQKTIRMNQKCPNALNVLPVITIVAPHFSGLLFPELNYTIWLNSESIPLEVCMVETQAVIFCSQL